MQGSSTVSRRTRRRWGWFGAIAAIAAALLATAGGALADTQLSLVAYSTPQEAFDEAHQGVPGDRRRARTSTFTQSYGASGDQSRAVAAGLQADVVDLSLEPDVTRLVKAGLVAPTWNAEQVQGHGHRLGRRVRRPQGQPEEHQDLGRPDQARRRGAHAQPVHLGRRPLEHHGRLRRAVERGQDGPAGPGLPERAVQERPACRTTAPASRSRRSPAARATCFSPTRTRPSSPSRKGSAVDYIVPSPTILIENPVAVTATEHARSPRPRAFLDFLLHAGAQQIFADKGYRPVVGDPQRAALPQAVPDAKHVHIGDLGGWDDGQQRRSSTPRPARAASKVAQS